MNPERLLQHFDRISEAPDAIPRLRRFILELAVRGKLVEQDPNDEPVGELLNRIAAERQGLIAKGRLKAQKSCATVDADLLSQPIPATWKWMRLADLISFGPQNGISPKPTNNTESPKALTLTATTSGAFDASHYKHVDLREADCQNYWLSAGDVLFQRGNTREYVGIAAVFNGPEKSFVFPDLMIRVRFAESLSLRFIHTTLTSPLLRRYFAVEAIGASSSMPKISQGVLLNAPIPLPPLAEQHRIVAKVDELMALCDQLEAAKTEREQSRDRLVAASLHCLNSPVDTAETDAPDLPARQADSFRDHARFVFKHLSRLTTRPEHIKHLRQAILNLAVRGKLVPQDPNDEPAERLLEKITSERSTQKSFDSIAKSDEDEFRMASKSLRLPGYWALAPLANVALAIVDCPHSTPKWEPAGMLCVRTNQFRPGFLDLSDSRFVSEATFLERIQRLKPIEGDILYSREGGILGVACRVPPNIELCLGQRMMLIRPPSDINAAFLEMLLNSPLITEIAREKTTGGAAPRVNVSTVKAYPIPLPPLAEQHRIVARVDELMALSDQLEAQLTATEVDSRRLLEAVLHEALNPLSEVTEQLESLASMINAPQN